MVAFNYSKVWLFHVVFLTLRVGGRNNIIFIKFHSHRSNQDAVATTFPEKKEICLYRKRGVTIGLAFNTQKALQQYATW